MNTLKIYPDKRLQFVEENSIYITENKIQSFNIILPLTFGDYRTNELECEMRVYLSDDEYMSYEVSTASGKGEVPITNDITENVQTVKIIFFFTKDGNVIGKTNVVEKKIEDAPYLGDPLTPRAEFDEVISEQRQTIQEQSETITQQGETITQQSSQITELNGEVTELQGEVAEQAATITRQNTTIDELNRRVPPLQTLDPINPSQTQRTFNPESPNIGFPQVIVNPPTAEGLNFDFDNLKKDVEFLGGVGTYDPFPYNSVGGIYITEVDEDGYPVKFLVKDWEKAPETFPQFFDISASAVRSLRTIIFENCPSIKYFPQSCFSPLQYLKNIILPENLAAISQYCFQSPCGIEKIVFSRSVLEIIQRAFQQNSNLISVQLNSGIQSISLYAFLYCVNLETINLPNSLIGIAGDAFFGCVRLKNVTIENGFNCNNLNLSYSTRYSHDTILSWFNALADRTGETAYTLTIGTTNLNKMTAEEKAIATNKNWNLA